MSAAGSKVFDPVSLAYIAVFAALIAVLGLPGAIPVGPVPITLQTLGVMLAGAILGPLRGALSVVVLLLLVAVGLPLLSGGRGGIAVFFGPSAGYLIGWILGAFIVGLIVRAGAQKPTWLRIALGAVLGGIVAVYAIGIPVQSAVTGLGLLETVKTSLVFIPGDIVKAVLTVVITMTLWRAYPQAFNWQHRRPTASAAVSQ